MTSDTLSILPSPVMLPVDRGLVLATLVLLAAAPGARAACHKGAPTCCQMSGSAYVAEF